MKSSALSEMPVDRLVSEYAKLSASQGEVLDLRGSSAKINRLGKWIFAIQDELARRGESLEVLTSLFLHPNPWVRYNSANALLYTVPSKARSVIQAVVDSRDFPIAGHSGMTLSFFDGALSDLSPSVRGVTGKATKRSL